MNKEREGPDTCHGHKASNYRLPQDPYAGDRDAPIALADDR